MQKKIESVQSLMTDSVNNQESVDVKEYDNNTKNMLMEYFNEKESDDCSNSLAHNTDIGHITNTNINQTNDIQVAYNQPSHKDTVDKSFKSQYYLMKALYRHQRKEIKQLKNQNQQFEIKRGQSMAEIGLPQDMSCQIDSNLQPNLVSKQYSTYCQDAELEKLKDYYEKLLKEKDQQIENYNLQYQRTFEQFQNSQQVNEQIRKENDNQQNQIKKLRKNMQRLSKILKYKQQVLEEQFNMKLHDQIRNYHQKQKNENGRSKSCPHVMSEYVAIDIEINLHKFKLNQLDSVDNYNLQSQQNIQNSVLKKNDQEKIINEVNSSEKLYKVEAQNRQSINQKSVSNQIYSSQQKYIKNVQQKQQYLQNEKEKIFEKASVGCSSQEEIFGLIERLEKVVILTHELQSQLEKHLRTISFQVFQKSLKKLNKHTLKILNYFNMIEFGVNGYIVDGNDGHVDYLMVLNDKLLEREWKFKARFSVIKNKSRSFIFEVPKQLNKYFPVFPSSQIFNFSAHSDNFLQKRKQDLNKYFKVLFFEKTIQKYVNYNRLQEFIQQQIIQQLDDQNHFMVLENELQLNKYSRLCCKIKVNAKQQKMELMKQHFDELNSALQNNLNYNSQMINKLSQEMEKAEVNDSLLLIYFEDKYYKNQVIK